MKIIHTSDWHLGRSLYGKSRYKEFQLFLDWLAKLIEDEHIDVLLVAGDIFDNSTPGNRAQGLYYRFIDRISRSCCRHIVLVAGNHDSPSFLNAPKDLLRGLDVHVVSHITDSLEDEVITLTGSDNKPEAIICAVPYLRDRDIRRVDPGETIEDKDIKLLEGIRDHYHNVCSIAEDRRKAYGDIPIIVMGHLFTLGGKTIQDDGVREVGSLSHIPKDTFPDFIDYLALGHLHVPQVVAKTNHFRYSGSPIPMGYGEANQKKKVIRVEFNSRKAIIDEITVPCFQSLERLSGGLSDIEKRICELKLKGANVWLEVDFTGTNAPSNLREHLYELIPGTDIEIRRIKNSSVVNRAINRLDEGEALGDLDELEVFNRCLESHNKSGDEGNLLMALYKETLKSLHEGDINAG